MLAHNGPKTTFTIMFEYNMLIPFIVPKVTFHQECCGPNGAFINTSVPRSSYLQLRDWLACYNSESSRCSLKRATAVNANFWHSFSHPFSCHISPAPSILPCSNLSVSLLQDNTSWLSPITDIIALIPALSYRQESSLTPY